MINIRSFLVWIGFILLLVTPFVHALKITRISYDVGAVFFYFYLVFVAFLFFLAAVMFAGKRLFSGLGLFLIFWMAYSLCLLAFGLSGDVFSAAGDFIRFIFALSVYTFFSSVALAYICDETNIKKFVLFAVACVAFPLLSIYAISSGGGSVYFGLQSTLALLGVAFGLVYKRYLVLCLSLMIILLSGKRGVMLSALVIVLAFFSIEAYLYRVKAAIITIFMLAFSLMILIVFDLVPEPILIRLGYLVGESADIRMATAGRNEEIEYVMAILGDDPYAFWFGAGLGAGFTDDAGNFKSTVHFSPAGLVLKYGLLWMIALYVAFLWIIARGLLWIKIMGAESRVYQFWFLVFIGELVFSFSAYTLFQSFMLWMACAVVTKPRAVRLLNAHAGSFLR